MELAVSEAEEVFDRWRRRISLFLGPFLFAVVLFAPLGSLTPPQQRLAAVLAWVLTYWVGEAVPLPVTALLGPCLAVILGVPDKVKDAFSPFADPVIFLFLGSFLIARAMTVHGLDRRIAVHVMALDWVCRGPYRLIVAVVALTGGLSMWISNTAATAMVFPIVLGILGTMRYTDKKAAFSYRTGVLLAMAYAASLGGMATPIGTPPNLIAVGMMSTQLNVRVDFFQWMGFALPVSLVMMTVLCVLMAWLHPGRGVDVAGASAAVKEERRRLGPWSRGEKNALAAFVLAVALWLTPGVLSLVWGRESAVYAAWSARVPDPVVALVAGALLFVLPLDWGKGEFTLSWRDAVSIEWGTLLLFGGGITLGHLTYATGLGKVLGTGIVEASGVSSLWGLAAVSMACAILVTEFTSNTASANMLLPIVIAVARAANVSPMIPVVAATFGASLAFVLPVSTPPNAIVYSSGQVPITRMIRAGILLDLGGFALVLALLFGLAGLGIL